MSVFHQRGIDLHRGRCRGNLLPVARNEEQPMSNPAAKAVLILVLEDVVDMITKLKESLDV